MKIAARFLSAISTTRPRGVRVIGTSSPKLGRRLQCFCEDAFRQWIRLEADPLVESCCKRATYLSSSDDKRLADFWIGQQDPVEDDADEPAVGPPGHDAIGQDQPHRAIRRRRCLSNGSGYPALASGAEVAAQDPATVIGARCLAQFQQSVFPVLQKMPVPRLSRRHASACISPDGPVHGTLL
jgi:hypothetical protein